MAQPVSFSIRPQHHGEIAIFYCVGSLTAEHSGVLKDEVKKWIAGRKRIAIDLREVERMDSAGLGAIVGLYISSKKQNCEFELVNYSESIRDLLGMSHLLHVFEACGRSGTRMP